MHSQKREYGVIKEKREDARSFIPKVNCVNCGWTVAEARIKDGIVVVICKQCGVKNTVEARPKHDQS